METTNYRITIEAFDKNGVKLADMREEVSWEYLRRSRPRLLKTVVGSLVERFLKGHREIEKEITKRKPKKRRPTKLSLDSLLTQHNHCAHS